MAFVYRPPPPYRSRTGSWIGTKAPFFVGDDSLLVTESAASLLAEVAASEAVALAETAVIEAVLVDVDAVAMADAALVTAELVSSDTAAVTESAVVEATASVADTEVVAVADGSTTLTADASALETPTVTEVVGATADLAHVDAVVGSDQGSGAADAAGIDSGTVADDGVVSVAGTTPSDTDTATLAEIEALLADVVSTELATVSEAGLREPPDAVPEPPPARQVLGAIGPRRRKPVPVMVPRDDEDDEAVLAAVWQAWYE